MKIDELNAQFMDLKATGATGEKLASDTIEILKRIDRLLIDLEAGKKSEKWMGNLLMFAGEETLIYAQQVATILGTAKYQIEQLG